jgi:hypothetical protein
VVGLLERRVRERFGKGTTTGRGCQALLNAPVSAMLLGARRSHARLRRYCCVMTQAPTHAKRHAHPEKGGGLSRFGPRAERPEGVLATTALTAQRAR